MRLLAALSLGLALLMTLGAPSAVVAAAPKGPTYDPDNEGTMDRAARYIQKRWMSKTDEEITQGRLESNAALHPTWNPLALELEGIDGPEALQRILQMPPAPEKLEGVSDEMPWKAFRAGGKGEERKVWVVLATAPLGDPISRGMDSIFNGTLNLIAPPEGEPSLLDKLKDAASAPSGQDILSREDDVERDEATLRQERKQERVRQAIEKAKTYKFAVADFTTEPDLMWMWWIWKVPALLFITPSTSSERAYDIRTWKLAFVSGLDAETMVRFIGSGAWQDQLPVWTSALAPGGSRDYVTLWLARPANWTYDRLSKIPTWLVGMGASALGTTLIKVLHKRGGAKDEEEEGKRKKAEAEAEAEAKAKSITAKGESSGVQKAQSSVQARK